MGPEIIASGNLSILVADPRDPPSPECPPLPATLVMTIYFEKRTRWAEFSFLQDPGYVVLSLWLRIR